ncbi:uncharacterized protein KZ484_003965 isoform 2-T2 [Pholidichthys leucotaenia]
MAAGASARLEDLGPDQSPLVAVTLQRDVHRKKKYLEAEPKALGITQLGLSIYVITCTLVFLSQRLDSTEDIALFILSPLVMIAGILAIVAQNLHLPTLRACMGMQIVACGASFANLVVFLFKLVIGHYMYPCPYNYDRRPSHDEFCKTLRKGLKVFCAGGILIQAALFAISVTLACYCCKAANCCCPDRKMPVIAIYAPPAKPQEPAQRYDCMCIGGFTSGRTKDSNLQKITRRCEICLFVPKKMPRRDFRFINE